MKKVIMLAAVVAALASCQSKANKTVETETDNLVVATDPVTEITEVYTGTLPAADGPGINYVLTLNASTDGVDTIYTLDMTYLEVDTDGKDKTFSSKGKQQTVKKVVDKRPVTAVKLTPTDSNDEPMYFVIVNDSTLRLVNDSLQEAYNGLNYDIIKVKQ